MNDAIDAAKVPKISLKCGRSIPSIGMGTFGSDKYGPEEVSSAVSCAIRYGYRLFDCASVYGNEALIGKVFNEAFQTGTVEREELFITSKLWNDMHGPGNVRTSIEKTLADLKLSYVDAYFVHWPFPNYHAPGCDGDTRNPDSLPFSKDRFMSVWEQMEEIHDKGLARSLGMSNMTVSKLEAVLPRCKINPDLIEMEQHPSFQQQALFDYCKAHEITVIAYCPIGSPNRPDRDKSPDDVVDTELPEVTEVAKAHGIHPALVCVKWAVQRDSIPIPFSVHEKNYRSNLQAVTEDPLTNEEMELLKKAERNCRLVKGQVFLWPGAKSWEDLWD
ncbi:MAG: aldo/keto reductase [Treponema sp.]|jgi:alcohol dehydrogenase (NADP+)|nr:aldo/keto reductase [Treponema sp.]